jgi:hypothetical protein
MNRACIVIAVAGILAIGGCQRENNPLVSASDGQFSRLVEPKNAFSPSCAAALYEPDGFVQQYNALKFSPDARISAVSDQQRAACVDELQKRASEVGIAGNVTAEHLRDERVRQRYLATRKK